MNISGVLDGPFNIRVATINLSTIYLTWSSPFTLNVSASSLPNILGYQIIIKNLSGEIIHSANSTANEYYFTLETDDCRWNSCETCVAGVNGAGIGLFSQPNTLSPNCKNFTLS